MLSFKIAARFLRTSPVQSAIIAIGIAVGIALNVFVGSLISSLQATLLDQTIGSSPHLTIQAPKLDKSILFTDAMRKIVTSDPHVSAVAPVRQVSAVYTNGSDSAPLTLLGGQVGQLDSVYKLVNRTVSGSAQLASGDIMIGTDFAKKYGLGPGSRMLLRLPGGSTATLVVSGAFDLGAAAFNERTAFASDSFAASALGQSNNQYSAVEIQIRHPFQSPMVAADWRARPAFQGVQITDWQAQNKDLLQALQSQGGSSTLIQTFVLLAVAIGIASTLAISAVQKTRQIGILKAMGMNDWEAASIFVWESAVLGSAGTFAGIGAGLGLIGLFQSAAPTTFPIRPQADFIAITCLAGIGISLASAVFPARRTSRLDPIEVIQSG